MSIFDAHRYANHNDKDRGADDLVGDEIAARGGPARDRSAPSDRRYCTRRISSTFPRSVS
jgi:hypothetical protein